MRKNLTFIIGLFAFLFLLPFVTSAQPVLTGSSIVSNNTTDVSQINLGSITGNGDIAFVTFSGRDGSVINIDSVDPSFTRYASAGTTRRSEIWAYESIGAETVMPIITDDLSLDAQVSFGFLITGAHDDWLAQSFTYTQTNEANKTKQITTLRNNSLLLAIVTTSSNTASNSTVGDLRGNLTSGSNLRSFLVTRNTTTAGTYNIGVNLAVGSLSSMIVLEIASEANGTANPSTNFNATATSSHNLSDFVESLYDSTKPNILWIGDSVSVPSLASRWQVGFLKNFNHSLGYSSLTWGAGTTVTNSYLKRNVLASFSGNSTYSDYGVTNDYFGDDSFNGSLWFNDDMVIRLANGFNGTTTGNIVSWHANSSVFERGRIRDWFTGNQLTMQLGYLFESRAGFNYSTNFSIKNGTGNGLVAYTYNTTDSSKIIGGIKTKQMNLLSDKVYVDSSTRQIILGNVSGTTITRFFVPSVIKINNENNTNGVAFAGLGQESVSYQNFYANATPTQTSKQISRTHLTNYLASIYNGRTDGDNFVFLAMGAEGGTVETQIDKIKQLTGNLTSAYIDAGLTSPKIILIGTWRTFDTNESLTQSEVFYNVSNEFSNVYYVSMYGLTNGILLNNSQEQRIWFEQNNLSSITFNNGSTINLSQSVLVDGSSGVHQNGEEAAFFFGYLLNRQLENTYASLTQENQSSTNTQVEDACNDLNQQISNSIPLFGVLIALVLIVVTVMVLMGVVRLDSLFDFDSVPILILQVTATTILIVVAILAISSVGSC